MPAKKLQHSANTFDAVFMINYIEHVIHPRDELKKAFSVLKPGGWIIGELPNFESIDRMLYGRFWGGNHVPRHAWQFGPKSLSHFLNQSGFTNIVVKQELDTAHLVLSIQNFLQRRHQDLKINPTLTSGRMKWFSLLLVLFLPLNALFVLIGKAGVMTFQAQKSA